MILKQGIKMIPGIPPPLILELDFSIKLKNFLKRNGQHLGPSREGRKMSINSKVDCRLFQCFVHFS
jgi:hypothetical protein